MPAKYRGVLLGGSRGVIWGWSTMIILAVGLLGVFPNRHAR
jgi:hypothetical protein